jgi:hypothetical protein
MKIAVEGLWKLFVVGGGWAPVLVLAAHMFLSRVVHAYQAWPPLDVPVHFSGGVAIAYLVSRCFLALPRHSSQQGRLAILELLLIASITGTTAVFWEFAEFGSDQLFGTNVQVGLANTMKDLSMGMLGAVVFMGIRARQLRAGAGEIKELTLAWVKGRPV